MMLRVIHRFASNMLPRGVVGAVAVAAAITTAGLMPMSAVSAEGEVSTEAVTVYKSPTCGCCGAWVDHLRENGFAVEVIEQLDVSPEKRRFGVPERLYSCHTARVGGYTIEGHVPADDIKRLLIERPALAGLSVPGMPHGSPGMETGRVDSYAVIGFDSYRNTRIFSRY